MTKARIPVAAVTGDVSGRDWSKGNSDAGAENSPVRLKIVNVTVNNNAS
jgi:hypothetical protein